MAAIAVATCGPCFTKCTDRIDLHTEDSTAELLSFLMVGDSFEVEQTERESCALIDASHYDNNRNSITVNGCGLILSQYK